MFEILGDDLSPSLKRSSPFCNYMIIFKKFTSEMEYKKSRDTLKSSMQISGNLEEMADFLRKYQRSELIPRESETEKVV